MKQINSLDNEKSFLRLSLSRIRNAPFSFSGWSNFFSASMRFILPKYHLGTKSKWRELNTYDQKQTKTIQQPQAHTQTRNDSGFGSSCTLPL